MDITLFKDPNFIVLNNMELDLKDYPIIFEAGDFISIYNSNNFLIIGDGGKRFIINKELSEKLLSNCNPIINNYESYTESANNSSMNYKLASLKEFIEPINNINLESFYNVNNIKITIEEKINNEIY